MSFGSSIQNTLLMVRVFNTISRKLNFWRNMPKLILTPVRDSYNTNPEPTEFFVTGSTISITVDGQHGERELVFKKLDIKALLNLSDTYEDEDINE